MSDDDAGLKTPSELEAVTTRLIRWGCWVRSERYGQGYPPHSWEGRAFERGGAAPDLSPRPLPDYPEEEQTETLITQMPGELKAICKEHYVAGGTLRDKCRALHVEKRVYFDRLRMAKYWLKARVG